MGLGNALLPVTRQGALRRPARSSRPASTPPGSTSARRCRRPRPSRSRTRSAAGATRCSSSRPSRSGSSSLWLVLTRDRARPRRASPSRGRSQLPLAQPARVAARRSVLLHVGGVLRAERLAARRVRRARLEQGQGRRAPRRPQRDADRRRLHGRLARRPHVVAAAVARRCCAGLSSSALLGVILLPGAGFLWAVAARRDDRPALLADDGAAARRGRVPGRGAAVHRADARRSVTRSSACSPLVLGAIRDASGGFGRRALGARRPGTALVRRRLVAHARAARSRSTSALTPSSSGVQAMPPSASSSGAPSNSSGNGRMRRPRRRDRHLGHGASSIAAGDLRRATPPARRDGRRARRPGRGARCGDEDAAVSGAYCSWVRPPNAISVVLARGGGGHREASATRSGRCRAPGRRR